MGGGGGLSRSKDPGYKAITEAPPLKGAAIGGGGGPSSQELIAIGTSVAVIVVALICFFLIYRFRSRICKSKQKTQKQEYRPANTDEGYDGEPPVRTYVV